MKRQILFSLALIGMSCVSLQAAESSTVKGKKTLIERSKKTLTGKSSWTIAKGATKIVIGAPLALYGFRYLFGSVPLFAIGFIGSIVSGGNSDAVIATFAGAFATAINAGLVYGGGKLAYSGIQDLNDEEESKEPGEAK